MIVYGLMAQAFRYPDGLRAVCLVAKDAEGVEYRWLLPWDVATELPELPNALIDQLEEFEES